MIIALFLIAIQLARGAEPSTGQILHDRIVKEYLESQWDQAAADLATLPRTPSTNTTRPSAQSDLDYIHKTLAECRPPWWKQIKAGKKMNFRPSVWGRTQSATYDPTAKISIQLNYLNGVPSVTVMWDAAEMDNPAEAEHGFTKGDLNDLSIWQILGTTDSWTTLSLRSQSNLDEKAQLLLSRYLQFRGNVSGAYYGTPRARRWDLWLDLASYEEKYAKMSAIMSRKAVAAMFMAEVVGHAAKYPSITIPSFLPDEGAEAKLAEQLRGWIGPHGLTLAEDESLRAAINAFATANGTNVRTTGKVTLPNGLVVSLDSEADQTNLTARETWLRDELKKRAN
jgi:hypothetical protein